MGAASSSPTAPAMSSTRATWPWRHRSPMSRWSASLSTPASPLYLEALYKRTLPAARINQLFVLLVIASASFILLMGLQFITPQTQASPGEVSSDEGVNKKSSDRPAEETQQKSKASPGSAPTAQRRNPRSPRCRGRRDSLRSSPAIRPFGPGMGEVSDR